MINYKIKKVEEMTIDELIGQVIMIGLPGQSLDEESKKFIEQYSIGNYILFTRNYNNTNQMKSFMKELYQYTIDKTGSFPLVSIDQEGGMVVRLFKDVTFPASPLTTSATLVKDAPYKTGLIVGKDMLKMGINLNLAPCLEVNDNLSNPLINVRGYGGTKEIVLKNASLFVKGVQESGALSCIKHFPGAGSSTKDSHLELPIIEDAKETLLNYNMYPFINLTDSDALMSSHCIYKSFDEYPSTLSKILLTETLRNQYGFDGLIISDGMEMNAIKDYYGIGEGCVMALNAGCDILLLCHEYDEQLTAFKAVKKAVEENIISVDTLKDKVRRINRYKEKLINKMNEYFTSEEYVVQTKEHELMQEIVDNSYTLVKGTAPYIDENTLVIASNVMVASIAEDEFDERNLNKVLKHSFKNNEIIEFRKDDDFIEEVMNKVNNYKHILIYSYDAYRHKVQKELINKILKLEKEVHVISIKGPSDRFHFEGLKNYSCLYEYTPNSLRTIVKQLKHEINLNGKLPL